MSISSALYAEYANEVLGGFNKKLEAAINSGDMKKVWRVLTEMKKFRFSE